MLKKLNSKISRKAYLKQLCTTLRQQRVSCLTIKFCLSFFGIFVSFLRNCYTIPILSLQELAVPRFWTKNMRLSQSMCGSHQNLLIIGIRAYPSALLFKSWSVVFDLIIWLCVHVNLYRKRSFSVQKYIFQRFMLCLL